MDTAKFEEAFSAVKESLHREKLDAVINLTSSGGIASDELRMAHLRILKPEVCSLDAGTMNWADKYIFENSPEFLDKLCACALEYDIKPELEIFDAGMMGNALHLIKLGKLKTPCHFQFVLGQLGGMEGNVESLLFLKRMLPQGATWSVTGIGRAHLPMLLAGLSMGCDGVRVGLEDNIYLSRGVKTTNEALVERAVSLAKLAGREIATAQEAREILSITRSSLVCQ